MHHLWYKLNSISNCISHLVVLYYTLRNWTFHIKRLEHSRNSCFAYQATNGIWFILWYPPPLELSCHRLTSAYQSAKWRQFFEDNQWHNEFKFISQIISDNTISFNHLHINTLLVSPYLFSMRLSTALFMLCLQEHTRAAKKACRQSAKRSLYQKRFHQLLDDKAKQLW